MFVVYRFTLLGLYKAMFVSHGPLIKVSGIVWDRLKRGERTKIGLAGR